MIIVSSPVLATNIKQKIYDSKRKKKQEYMQVVVVKMKKELHQTRANLVLFGGQITTSEGSADFRCILGIV